MGHFLFWCVLVVGFSNETPLSALHHHHHHHLLRKPKCSRTPHLKDLGNLKLWALYRIFRSIHHQTMPSRPRWHHGHHYGGAILRINHQRNEFGLVSWRCWGHEHELPGELRGHTFWYVEQEKDAKGWDLFMTTQMKTQVMSWGGVVMSCSMIDRSAQQRHISSCSSFSKEIYSHDIGLI